MTTFTCSYPFNGHRHVVHVDAENEVEASHKLRAIGMTAVVDGELIAEIPLVPHRIRASRIVSAAVGAILMGWWLS